MKKILLLMILVFGLLIVGCGKDKGQDTNTTIVENISKNLSPDELIKELYSNEKYGKKVMAYNCFYPKYKELVFETFAKREEKKSQSVIFCYETDDELNDLKEYINNFNKNNDTMKILESIDIPVSNSYKPLKLISFPLDYPNK